PTASEHETGLRLPGLKTRPAVTNDVPVLAPEYLVYETPLARPDKHFDGVPIYHEAWKDVGSHRIYFLEITAIQLRQDIAEGRSQIRWRALATWEPQTEDSA